MENLTTSKLIRDKEMFIIDNSDKHNPNYIYSA